MFIVHLLYIICIEKGNFESGRVIILREFDRVSLVGSHILLRPVEEFWDLHAVQRTIMLSNLDFVFVNKLKDVYK